MSVPESFRLYYLQAFALGQESRSSRAGFHSSQLSNYHFCLPRVEFINHSRVARLTLFLLQDKELNHFDSLVDVVVQSLLDLVDVVLVILLLNHSWLHNFIDQLLALRFQVKPLHLV
jgi:hypothetical protein